MDTENVVIIPGSSRRPAALRCECGGILQGLCEQGDVLCGAEFRDIPGGMPLTTCSVRRIKRNEPPPLAARVAALLRRIEFSAEAGACPCCGCGPGHCRVDGDGPLSCELAALLAEVEG